MPSSAILSVNAKVMDVLGKQTSSSQEVMGKNWSLFPSKFHQLLHFLIACFFFITSHVQAVSNFGHGKH